MEKRSFITHSVISQLKSDKSYRYLFIILLASFFSRLIYFLLDKNNPLFLFPIVDESEYIATAYKIMENKGIYPFHFWHPPAYSYFLAFLFTLGLNLKSVVIIQFFMGAATGVMIFYALKRINLQIAFISSLIWMFYPVELFIETKFLSENLFIFLIALFLLLSIKLKSAKWQMIILPLLAGLIIITKTQFLLFVLIYLSVLLLRKEIQIKKALVYLAISLIFPLLVSMHNYQKTGGSFVFVSSNGPVNLYIGNSSDIKESLNIRPHTWKDDFFPNLYNEAGIYFYEDEDLKEGETYPYKLSAYLVKKTLKDNKNISTPLSNILSKTFITLNAHETPRNYDLYANRQFNIYLKTFVHEKPLFFPLVLFYFSCLIFLFVRRKQLITSKEGLLLLILIISLLLPSILFFNAFRYRLAALPLIIFFAINFYHEYWKDYKLQLIHLLMIAVFGSVLLKGFLIQQIPSFESNNYFGNAYLHKGDLDNAEKFYLLALENARSENIAEKQLSGTYRGLAFLGTETGKKELAEYAMEKAIESDTSQMLNFYNMASIKFRNQDFEGAITDYTTAINMKERQPELRALAYYGRGLAKIRLPDFDGALRDLDESIKLNPKYAESWANRGIIKGQTGFTEEAIQDLSRAIELKPDYDLAYQNRAIAYFASNNPMLALNDLNTAIKINPLNREALYLRGMTYVQQGDIEGGCIDLKKSAELGLQLAVEKVQTYCK